jgi:hypothetical protein
MSHSEQEFFVEKLRIANELVEVGAKYIHAKTGGQYILERLVIIEATEEVGVAYQALYGEKIVWLRPLSDFLGEVEVDGKLTTRFIKEGK